MFWQKINNLELFASTKNNVLRAVVPLANNEKLMKYLKNKYKYYIDWSGSLFWIEVADKDEKKIKEIKKFILKIDGYLTIIKRSENFSFDENLFTINENRLLFQEKLKKVLIQKEFLIQEKCIERYNANKFFRNAVKR